MNQPAPRARTAGPALERATKLAVLGWATAALAVEIWLLRGSWPGLPAIAAAGFAAAALSASFDRRAVALVLALTYIFPSVVYFWTGHYYPLYSAAWMALLVGAMAPDAVRTPWHLPAPWRGPLICWALVTIVGASIVFAREIDFTPALFDVTTIANTSRGGWPAFIIRYVLHVALVTLVGILWFDWLAAMPENHFLPAVAAPLAAGAVALGLVAVYQLFVDVTFLNPTFYAHLMRASGTVFDANICGTIAALWIGGSILLTDRLGPRAPYAAAAGMALGWMAVWASGSRTGFAAAVIVTLFSVIAVYVARARVSRGRALVSAAAAGGVVALVLVVLARAPLGVIGPAARLAPDLGDLSSESVVRALKENLWIRNGYGIASTAMIAARPWFGVGVGSFQTLLPEFVAESGDIPPDNAQNWYRHQLAEFGVAGSLPWILWTIAFGLFVLRRRAADPPRTWVARGIVIAFGAISFVGMPGQDAAVAITFWTMAFWYVRIAGQPAPRPLRAAAWGAIAAILVVFAAGTAYAAATDLRVPARAHRGRWFYAHGFFPPLPEEKSTGGWTGRRAVAVFESPTRWMKLTVSVDYRTLGPADGARPASHAPTRPSDVKVWFNEELVIDERLVTTAPLVRFVPVPEGKRWVRIETWAGRAVRPREFGLDDDRDLGMLIEWDYVQQPAASSMPEPG